VEDRVTYRLPLGPLGRAVHALLVRRQIAALWRYRTRRLGELVGPLVQTINIATLGTALAVLLSIPVAFLAARNTTFNRATYALGRVVMSVSRSVDSLIWALIFIIVVGPGSLAGALAVAVRSIGFVSKLFAEGIEEIDRGQVEAITATGAGRFKVLLYGIVPQIRPVFAGVTIYRWDINIRESTVLGIVGAAVASAILSFLGITLGGWLGYLIAGFIGACLLIWIVRAVQGRTA